MTANVRLELKQMSNGSIKSLSATTTLDDGITVVRCNLRVSIMVKPMGTYVRRNDRQLIATVIKGMRRNDD